MIRLALAALLAGCFSKPQLGGDAGGSGSDGGGCRAQPQGSGMQLATPTGAAWTARFPGDIVLSFADQTSHYPFPSSLMLEGTEVIGPQGGCQNEDQVGLAAYPVWSVSGNDVTTTQTHSIRAIANGPAFVALQVDWAVMYAPGGSCPAPFEGEGHSVFSLFPDGRIVRTDAFTPSTSGTPAATNCQCSAANGVVNYIASSFLTLNRAALASTTLRTDTAERNILIGGEHVTGACSRTQLGDRIAVRWDQVDNVQKPAVFPTRVRDIEQGSYVAFVYDLIASSEMVTMLPNQELHARTHLLVDTANSRDCIAMMDHLDALVSSAPLRVDGMPIAYGAYGVFDDARAHAAPVELTTGGAIAPGMTVALRFPGFAGISTNVPDDKVVWQHEEEGTFYLYFPDGLANTSPPIVVTPECPQ